MATSKTSKSADAFRTISEAAEELDVPQHVLRHWEDVFGQIRPMRRAGGRRYYRPVDLDLLRGVRALLYDKRYTTRGVQQIFKEHGAKYVSAIGRHAATGETIPLTPGADPTVAAKSDEHQDLAPAPLAPLSEAQIGSPTKRTATTGSSEKAMLLGLLQHLETVQAALNEAVSALNAITPGANGAQSNDQPDR